ncbi:MAG: zinc ABC transporter substrate-binding protein [Methanobacteriaceae archaeon]
MEKRNVIITSVLICFAAAVLLIYSAPRTQADIEGSDKINVAVSIPPQAEFVERVGGSKVKVTTMVPAGAHPHTYEPLPEQLKEISNAEMYVKVGSGLEFENVWMDEITEINKNMLVVNSSKGINFIPGQDKCDHKHGGESQYDTHVWVSPRNAKIMVENIYQGLIQIDPANKDYYRANKDKYLQELYNLDKNITATLAGVEGKKILVYHPAWGYFARDYGLTQIAIEKDGKEPTPQGILSVIDQARRENIRVVFISPQFTRRSAEKVASEIGGQVVMIDHLDKNYIENLKKVAEAFRNSLQN